MLRMSHGHAWIVAAFVSVTALAGCSSVAGTGPSAITPATTSGARTQPQPEFRGSTAALPQTYDTSGPLLFVTDWQPIGQQYGFVYIYDPRKNNPTPVATISEGIATPQAVCLDSKGTLYVTNLHSEPFPVHGWVSAYLPGQTTPEFIIRLGISIPYGCAIDSNDDLLVSNWGADNITKYTRGDAGPTVVLDRSNGLLDPSEIVLDKKGDLYVVNNDFVGNVANVQMFKPGAKHPTKTITDGAWWPQGMAIDSKGIVYVSNFETSTKPGAISEYMPGQTSPFQTITSAGPYPWGLTLDQDGRLFVSRSENPGFVSEYAPGALGPSPKKITQGLILPAGMAHWRTVLP